jgi:hypothetical protein
MSLSNKIDLKGTLRQVIIRVYSLEIDNSLCTFSHVGIFNPALGSVLSFVAPLPFSLVQPFLQCSVGIPVCGIPFQGIL